MAHRKPDAMGSKARAREESIQLRDSIMRLERAAARWSPASAARAAAHDTLAQLRQRQAQVAQPIAHVGAVTLGS